MDEAEETEARAIERNLHDHLLSFASSLLKAKESAFHDIGLLSSRDPYSVLPTVPARDVSFAPALVQGDPMVQST